MSIAAEVDDLELAMPNVLLTTRATAVCPFHQEVTIRVGDDAAETHAFYRARNIVKSDGARWDHDLFVQEIARQLAAAACPAPVPDVWGNISFLILVSERPMV